MKRRSFIGTSVTAAAGMGIMPVDSHAMSRTAPAVKRGRINKYSLIELRDLYRYDIFEDYVPFHDQFTVDHEIGGFTIVVDRDGTPVTTNKGAWSLGRGIWTYSYLYNNLDQNPRHLEAARKAVEFALERRPEGDTFWPSSFSREGEPIAQPERVFYGSLFIANGIAEFSKSPGNERYWDIAKDILLMCVRRYDRSDYPSFTLGEDVIEAPRIQGHWMCLINTITGMLEYRSDRMLESIIDRSIDAVLNYHYHPDFGLNNEVINHDLSRPDNAFAQQVLTGHSIETFWMIMYEAVRRRDKDMWDISVERFKRHLEVAWDYIYEGAFHELRHVDNNEWNYNSKANWLQAEILIGAMYMIEHTGDEWAKEWFERTYSYVRDKFVLKQYGFPLWIDYADRKVTFQRHARRAENFHHPRHLMFNLVSIENMIKRRGKTSGVFG